MTLLTPLCCQSANADKKQEKKSSSYPSSYGCILNVGTGKAIKIRDLAHTMIKIFNLDLEPIYLEPRRGDIVNSLADISRLETVLGFVPSCDIVPSLKQMLKQSD